MKFIKSNLFQSLLAFAIKIGAGFFSYLLFVVAARIMTPTDFGIFSVIFSLVMIFGIFGNFGQQIFIVKEIPKEISSGDLNGAAGVYIFSLIGTTIVSIISAVLMYVLVSFIYPEFQKSLVIASAVLCILYSISQTTMGMLRIQDKVIYGIISRDLIWRVVSVISLIGYSWFVSNDALNAAINILSISLFFVVVHHIIKIWRDVSANYIFESAIFKNKQWISTSTGLMFVAVISGIDLYIYTIFVERYLSPIEAGVFFASMKTVELMNLFLMAVTLVIAPKLSKLISKGDYESLQKECNSSTIIQGIPALIAALIVVSISDYLLNFFNESFSSYSLVLDLLTLGVLFNALTGATVLLMQLTGQYWKQMIYQGGILLISVLSLVYLLPEYGVIGAAYAYVFSKIVWNILAIIAIKNKTGVDPSVFGLIFNNKLGILGTLNYLIKETRHGR